jgi:bifunctional non-homologous end joining protein LigD
LKPFQVPGAVKRPLPAAVKPQLCELVGEPPDGDAWLHEVKLDGYRLLCWIDGQNVILRTRREHDWTHRFPHLVAALRSLAVGSAILDGEVVALRPDGTSSFSDLVTAFSSNNVSRLIYFVFDLLYLDGYDLRGAACDRRKQALAPLLHAAAPPLQYLDHIEGEGPRFSDECRRHGLEGVISKRRDSPYRGGRTSNWLKAKFTRETDFVIGGFTRPKGSRLGLGAILVGFFDGEGRLVYAGRVGSGMDGRTLSDLRDRLAKLEQPKNPFVDLPRQKVERGTRWVEPQLVAKIRYGGWSHEGLLWHPVYQGLREDVPASSVTEALVRQESAVGPDVVGSPPKVRSTDQGHRADQRVDRETQHQEEPRPAQQTRRGWPAPEQQRQLEQLERVQLTHPERVLYPEAGITKLDLATYYVEVADWILPHIVGRPLALVRCPEGAAGHCFFQKKGVSGTPDAVARIELPDDDGKSQHLVVRDLAGLVSLVQMSVLEIHPWGARSDEPEKPDRVVFDLDPGPDVAWAAVVRFALQLRDLLGELGLTSFVKTTGGKGLHIVVPLQRRHEWPEVKVFSQAVAKRLVAHDPASLTATMAKSARQGRIFIDFHRNRRGATAVAAYSTRVHPNASISAPLAWEELAETGGPAQYTLHNIRERLASLERDPWAPLPKVRQSITARIWEQLR